VPTKSIDNRIKMPDIVPIVDARDQELIYQAAQHLEHPSLAARLSNAIGTPMEVAFELMPRSWQTRLNRVVRAAAHKSLQAAIAGIYRSKEGSGDAHHKALVGLSGAVGGFFGLPGLLVELPITTTLMLRSIADIARSEGEDLSHAEARRECLSVFALGGRTEHDDATETGYYGVRAALALTLSNAASSIHRHGLQGAGTPAAAKLISAVASRFGIPVSQKAAAQSIPYVGAAAGALVNTVFVHHFQTVGRSHFVLRRLERKYGVGIVEAEYERVRT
jgi:hypothetical protein